MHVVIVAVIALLGARAAVAQAYVEQAFADWGVPRTMNVTITGVPDEDTDPTDGMEVAHTDLYLDYRGVPIRNACGIVLREVFWTLTKSQQIRAVRHEAGHCFWLDHHGGRGVMGPHWGDVKITAAERALAHRSIWMRRVLPMVGVGR